MVFVCVRMCMYVCMYACVYVCVYLSIIAVQTALLQVPAPVVLKRLPIIECALPAVVALLVRRLHALAVYAECCCTAKLLACTSAYTLLTVPLVQDQDAVRSVSLSVLFFCPGSEQQWTWLCTLSAQGQQLHQHAFRTLAMLFQLFPWLNSKSYQYNMIHHHQHIDKMR